MLISLIQPKTLLSITLKATRASIGDSLPYVPYIWGTDHITPAILVQKGHARQKISEITSHFDPKMHF